MVSVNIETHDFGKVNLVTTKKGDLYKCSICGCEGYRQSLSNTILLSNDMGKKALKCTYKQPLEIKRRPKLVLTDRIPVDGGVDAGLHEVVECPEDQKEKYIFDVWILSKRGNPVRILPHEIISQEF